MRDNLPEQHGLTELALEYLVPQDPSGVPSLTDVQYHALEFGIARGESVLISSPTSTGKTLIAQFAITALLRDDKQSVYLVTHRALARQKFEEFLHPDFLSAAKLSEESIVLATGDEIVNGKGMSNPDPMVAGVLIATYEKYLAILSATGIPEDLQDTAYICDELQLVGDEYRGEHVELLLTLLRQAGWGQFIGLSATIGEADLRQIASWLRVRPLRSTTREKQLVFELWTPQARLIKRTDSDEDESDSGHPCPIGNLEPKLAIDYLLSSEEYARPLLIFCMHKRTAYQLAEAIRPRLRKNQVVQLDLDFESLPSTEAHRRLTKALPIGLGIHTADLVEVERRQVERQLQNGDIEVVVATSTLAAGVHYPFGTVLFAEWKRYNPRRNKNVPISRSEFHNMAGRAGRMGTEHASGQVIFLAKGGDIAVSRRYLEVDGYEPIRGHLYRENVDSIILNLVCGGLCTSSSSLKTVICDTLTVIQEQERDSDAISKWESSIDFAVAGLVESRLLQGDPEFELRASRLGRAASRSGFRLDSVEFLIRYCEGTSRELVDGLRRDQELDWKTAIVSILHALFSSPVFSRVGGRHAQRALNFSLNRDFNAPMLSGISHELLVSDPRAYEAPSNASSLTFEWISGVPIEQLETRLERISAGILSELFRNASWALNGLANILDAVLHRNTDTPEIRAQFLEQAGEDEAIFALPRLVRRIARMALHGVPDEGIWLLTVEIDGQQPLSRREIMSLIDQRMTTPQECMRSDEDAERRRQAALEGGTIDTQKRSNGVRDGVRGWKSIQRERAAGYHLFLTDGCDRNDLVAEYYESSGDDFEKAFENILEYLKIRFDRLDQRGVTGAPDYVLYHEDDQVVVELKSSTVGKLINYNKSTEVLSASEMHGRGNSFCVTLCHPGVDPAVPVEITKCKRLSVVESADLGEALVRVCQGRIGWEDVFRWLTSPGQALVTDLYH